jgi:hypothetical protein
MYTDATLARELVAAESKRRQFNTFPKCVWDWTCQKNYLEKNRGKSVHGYYTFLGVRWSRD